MVIIALQNHNENQTYEGFWFGDTEVTTVTMDNQELGVY